MARALVRRESVETEMHKSDDKRTTFVFTKKRGYDVTRTPHLNKVSARGTLVSILSVCFSEQRIHKYSGAFRYRRKQEFKSIHLEVVYCYWSCFCCVHPFIYFGTSVFNVCLVLFFCLSQRATGECNISQDISFRWLYLDLKCPNC